MTYYDNDGAKIENLPTCWAICGECHGDGATSAYLGAIDHDDWDEDELRAYLNGAYDRSCDACRGSGKVKTINYDQLTPDQRVDVEDQDAQVANCHAEMAAEQRMGC